eukprot:Platyproteum_vivax@DN3767_c0_g1_i1.p1
MAFERRAQNSFQLDREVGVPQSESLEITLTDFYQITMVYAYWHANKHEEPAAFDLFFRKCPFKGEFCVCGGVHEAMKLLNTACFTDAQIDYIRGQLPTAKEEFFLWLRHLDCSAVTVHAIPDGTFVFPRVPLMRVEGPLGICQLLETPLLNALNYASLVATNACRHRLLVGENKQLLEFGARRAQGPDGAMSASKYSYMGGFDGTSNTRAGQAFNIPVTGTHAHSFVAAFKGLGDLEQRGLPGKNENIDFVSQVTEFKNQMETKDTMNEGELAAFISYAQTFPDSCLCLVDTYDTLASGVPNFIAVALALLKNGCKPVGIRLDSGDLAYLSRQARRLFVEASEKFGVPELVTCQIVASNDITEDVIQAINAQGHEIDSYGIGTHLVTCKAQPALGLVYKLVSINGQACMKLSQDESKTSLPALKRAYRLCVGETFDPVMDLMTMENEPVPREEEKTFCRHLFDERKRCYVLPTKVEPLLVEVWSKGKTHYKIPTLEESRARCLSEMKRFRKDYLRLLNATPYRVSGSSKLYEFFHDLWLENTPCKQLK